MTTPTLQDIADQPVHTVAIADKGAVWVKRPYGWMRPAWAHDPGAFITDEDMAEQIAKSASRSSAPAVWSFL